MNALLPMPIVLPLLGAALSIMAFRHRSVQRMISLAVLSSTATISCILLIQADTSGPVVAQPAQDPAAEKQEDDSTTAQKAVEQGKKLKGLLGF